ncbi:MAG: hypothetical protein Ct9H300mP12_13540 [Acidimicrobiales bacterium]|nr:MAG: hypothetical protein Ct9H300mP12_13540 [Acidimicrobiales bacterium]
MAPTNSSTELPTDAPGTVTDALDTRCTNALMA